MKELKFRSGDQAVAELVIEPTAIEFNNRVRCTQKVQPGKCNVCGAEGVAFMCQACGKLFCSWHAFNTFGYCPDCCSTKMGFTPQRIKMP